MDEFVSEPLVPVPGTADASAMSRGEPGVPARFTWRGAVHEIASRLASWKTSTRERGELYLRRHWHEVITNAGVRMTIYCERQPKTSRRAKQRWFVYSIRRSPSEGTPDRHQCG